MNESLQNFERNEFDSPEADNKSINLKTIIIPGLTVDNDLEKTLNQVEFAKDKTDSANQEIVIESAEDIFIFSKPDYVANNGCDTKNGVDNKNKALSGLTQIPTSFENEKRNKTTDEFKSNIFLKNEKNHVVPLKQIEQLKQKTRPKAVLTRNLSSTKKTVKKINRSQKSYGLAITLLLCLIVVSVLFVLHLNNTINLHQITFDLYESSRTILSDFNKNEIIKGWVVLFT